MAKTTKNEETKPQTTVLEALLGKRGDDADSDLDTAQCTRLCHLLRAQGGEHGAALADALSQPAPTAQEKSEPTSEGTKVD